MLGNLWSFEDKHKGETCYIFGDGPSIRYFDYSNFTDHIGISCGNQIFHKNFSQLNVKYYSNMEPYQFYPNWMILSKRLGYLKDNVLIANEFRKIFKDRSDLEFFISLSNLFAIHAPNVTFAHKTIVQGSKKFDKFIKLGVNPFGGSFTTTLSLAMLMGFKRVYLIGFDAFTIQVSPHRWYEKTFPGIDLAVPDAPIKHDYLELYKEEMEILNISPFGTMCNLKDQNYVDYTGEALAYKENYEIINPTRIDLIKKRYPSA